MSAKDDLIVYAVIAAVAVAGAWYLKKKVGDVADDAAQAIVETFGEAWEAAGEYADGAWQATAPALDKAIVDVTGVPGAYTPGQSYPDYLAASNARRDALAASYGPQVSGGKVSTSNPINDAFTGLYQSVMGQGRTLGSDIYDWTH